MAKTTVPIELSSTPSIVDNGTATAITIDSNENVGIGANNPTDKIHLNGAANASTGITIGNNNSTRLRLYHDDNVGSSYLTTDGMQTEQILYIMSGNDLRLGSDGAERMRIDSSGNVGIGTSSPSGILHLYKASGTTELRIQSNQYSANYGFVGGALGTNALGIYDYGASAYRFVLDSSGNVGIGTSTAPRKLTVAGDFEVNSSGTNRILLRYDCTAEGFSTAASASLFGKNNSTGRSINAGGTINASGADYAEYMKKADSCGTIAKGDVCGVNSSGKLTDVFADAISFVIKSTNPSYVGGDTWGDVDLGLTEEQTETERQKYDRIAFSGQVPVNITGSFNVGDYVYPQANGTDIECVAKSSPTFEEYQLCVGKIWATGNDGRPIVAVKIG